MTKSIEEVWPLLQQHQHETSYTAKGLPFFYTIRGGELFVNRRRKSITVSTDVYKRQSPTSIPTTFPGWTPF